MGSVDDTRGPITIVVAVAVRLYREGLAATLSAHEHLRIEGTAGSSQEAVAAVRRLQPDIVIVDASFDDIRGLLGAVRSDSPSSRILALAVREEIDAIIGYAEMGADGFVTSNSSVAELVAAIERTTAGELHCTPRIAAQLLRVAANQSNRNAPDVGRTLTCREQQVFSLLQKGQSNKDIASILNIAEATVKNHVHHVLEKLQVSTRGRAAAIGAARV
jgi:two-component system, NarL family, nitrate/nitrite response regulator NarL